MISPTCCLDLNSWFPCDPCDPKFSKLLLAVVMIVVVEDRKVHRTVNDTINIIRLSLREAKVENTSELASSFAQRNQ